MGNRREHLDAAAQPRWADAVKRTMDVVAGSVLFVGALPVILGAALASAVTLRAWPLFRQPRPGLRAEPFHIVKIRTLPSTLPMFEAKADLAQVTPTLPWPCRFLRGTHLDELPQLALVVRGRMSLVGPRPSLPMAFEHIGETFELVRTSVRPGCTGLWQIGAAHDHTQGDDPEYDLFYLAQRTVRMDLWIIVRTVLFMARMVRPIELHDVPRAVLRVPAARDPRDHPAADHAAVDAS